MSTTSTTTAADRIRDLIAGGHTHILARDAGCSSTALACAARRLGLAKHPIAGWLANGAELPPTPPKPPRASRRLNQAAHQDRIAAATDRLERVMRSSPGMTARELLACLPEDWRRDSSLTYAELCRLLFDHPARWWCDERGGWRLRARTTDNPSEDQP